MSHSPRRSGSGKKSSSPLLNSLLRTAVSALASDPKSSSSHRSAHPEPGHLPRSHTQPEPRRPTDYSRPTGIPSHTTPSTSRDHTFELLKTAAYELGKLVHDVESKIRPSEKDKYRPEGLRSDADRFEEISDSDSTRHRSGERRRRGRSVDSGRHRERHRGGHADEYYGVSNVANGQGQGGFGYGDYTQQFNPAAQTQSYPYPPPGPQQHHLNHNNESYTHPLPSPQPSYPSPSDRPKLKRSKTSASKFAGDMGGELMRNLPALLDKAAWLLSLLEKKNATTRGGSGSGGHSALLMALGLVMELYRSLGGAEKIRSFNEKRAMKRERGMRAEERYERY